MPRIVKPLSSTQVKQAKPKEKEYTLSDGDGLLLSVRLSGAKVWLYKYQRPFSGKRTNLTLGNYPDISLADARRKRDEARALLAQDVDPKEYRDDVVKKREAEENTTLKLVAQNWFPVKKSSISEDHASDIWRSLELHIFPSLGNHPISVIKATTAIDVLKPIAAKGSLETVKRLCQRLNEVMTYAVNTGVIESNPLAKIHSAFKPPKKKHMPTLKPEELPELMKTLSTASIKLTTRTLIEWQLHTMTRPNEAAGATWKEIDLNRSLWVIPANRMKNRIEHSIPLTPQTLSLLDIMRPISGHGVYVFPSDRKPNHHVNEQTANAALKRMGFNGRLVSHGLRAIASTALNEQGFDPDVIEAALSHIDKNEVRRAYNRSDYLERRRSLMNWWSEHVQEASKGHWGLAISSNITQLHKITA
ncbi:integrase domain-containing protein [Vibrio makurazakiensis]|uniref:integrase domain-containing protein n=1 Tax=Vibrio makurazakiensis TaxID=2910250 RepID=UPI003D14EEE2